MYCKCFMWHSRKWDKWQYQSQHSYPLPMSLTCVSLLLFVVEWVFSLSPCLDFPRVCWLATVKVMGIPRNWLLQISWNTNVFELLFIRVWIIIDWEHTVMLCVWFFCLFLCWVLGICLFFCRLFGLQKNILLLITF